MEHQDFFSGYYEGNRWCNSCGRVIPYDQVCGKCTSINLPARITICPPKHSPPDTNTPSELDDTIRWLQGVDFRRLS